MTTKYINHIAPEHSRTSCDDENLYNAAYSPNDYGGFGRCHRCSLIAAFRYTNDVSGLGEEDEWD